MVALEEREYRSVCKKLAQNEERSKLLSDMKRNKVCLAYEEGFILHTTNKFKALKNKGDVQKSREEFLKLSLNLKIRDNNLEGVKLRKKRNWLRGKLESLMGPRSREYRRLMDDARKNTAKMKESLRRKNGKKLEHLKKKFGQLKNDRVVMSKEMTELVGKPRILDENVDVETRGAKDPIVVVREGEEIVLNEDEREALRLGPKFCVLNRLDDEEFEVDVEEMVMKLKWDMMGDSGIQESRQDADIAMEIVLGKDVCQAIDAEKQEELDMVEAETRCIYNWVGRSINFAKRRVTDIKGNSRVIFPRKARSFDEESSLQTLRLELSTLFRSYVAEKCQKGGAQKTNLSRAQERGLKSLKKRVKMGEIVVLPTDKSGCLAVMSGETYKEAGMMHTTRDVQVGWREVRDSQRELNGHVSMLIKIFKIGSYWKHEMRIRETMMGEGQAVCPLSLLYKDHKGWSPEMGTIPPTRPVAGGHLGINMHISEIVSDILDPIIGEHVGGREILSTEDMIARIEILNELHRGWSRVSYWRNMVLGEYRSCMECDGTDLYEWDDEDLELCVCDEYDGIDEEGRIMITASAMKSLRRAKWEQQVEWDPTDLDRRFTTMESLPEDVQDQSIPMVVVGTDVVNLYPSLDIGRVVEIVKYAILHSGVSWEEIDYLEASRYIALNWTKKQCDGSSLRRVLPTRRYTTGTRPGLTGAGPQGALRGDQEQWVFPSVKLTCEDKKLLVATVVQLATEAMFKNHFMGLMG